MNDQVWWYLSRSSGMVAWILLVGSLLLGVLLVTRALKPMDRPAWLLALHRWVSGLAVMATALHLGALIADNYVDFTVVDLVVPFASRWKPEALALGVVALYLLVLVQVTSLVMARIPKRLWRAIHLSSYAMVWLVTVHAGMAGTDVKQRIYQLVALMLTIVAVTAAVIRIIIGRRGAGRAADADAGSSAADRVAALAAARRARDQGPPGPTE